MLSSLKFIDEDFMKEEQIKTLLKNFNSELNLIKELEDVLNQLKKKGHPKYIKYQKTFSNSGGILKAIKEIEDEISKCKQDLVLWLD